METHGGEAGAGTGSGAGDGLGTGEGGAAAVAVVATQWWAPLPSSLAVRMTRVVVQVREAVR